MYVSLTSFLQTFSAYQPVLWALLVVAVVAIASLILFAFWELVWSASGGLFPGNASTRNRRSRRG